MMMPATVAGLVSLLQRDHAKPRASAVGLSAILTIRKLYHDFRYLVGQFSRAEVGQFLRAPSAYVMAKMKNTLFIAKR